MIKYIKPPLGIMPRFIYCNIINQEIYWNGGMSAQKIMEERLENLKGAIIRYAEAKLPVDIEWVMEYNELLIALSRPINAVYNRPITYSELCKVNFNSFN